MVKLLLHWGTNALNQVFLKALVWRKLLQLESSSQKVSHTYICSNCNQIGRFLKVLEYKFSFKRSPNLCDYLGYFEKRHFLRKNYFGYIFGQLFWGEIGLLFGSITYGHTAVQIAAVVCSEAAVINKLQSSATDQLNSGKSATFGYCKSSHN